MLPYLFRGVAVVLAVVLVLAFLPLVLLIAPALAAWRDRRERQRGFSVIPKIPPR